MKKNVMWLWLAALLLPVGAVADDHEEERKSVTDVWFMMPKMGMEMEFEEALKEHMALRAEKGDSREWYVFTPDVGKNLRHYQIRSENIDWSDLDSYDGENEGKGFSEHFGENVHPLVEHYHHYIEVTDYEKSHWPTDRGYGPLFAVTLWTVSPSAPSAHYDAVEQMTSMAVNDGWASDENTWAWINRIGGENQMMVVSGFPTYEAFGEDSDFFGFAVEQLGEKKAKAMFDAFGSGLADEDFTVWRYRSELSLVAED